MRILLPAIIVLAIVFGPGLWVKRVMARYGKPNDRYSGSGSELARHLLDLSDLQHVKVESTDKGDHYDPAAKAVRLSPDNFSGRSLTAISVAAHEVGHAVQDKTGYGPLRWRSRLVNIIEPGQRFAALLLVASPFVTMFTRAPISGVLTFLAGFLIMGLGALVHLITLPTEFNASFGRALPMLRDQNILYQGDEPHARKLLTAAAATYVAASLMSLLNIARWLVLLRR